MGATGEDRGFARNPAVIVFFALSMCFGQNRSELIKSAQSGDGRSQLSLGELYLAEDKYLEALYFYRLAAGQGLSEAQCALGNMYRYGQGVTQDYNEAIRWYRLAAIKG